jgi:hypothetical protein
MQPQPEGATMYRMKRRGLQCLAGIVLCVAAMRAHHSLSGVYDTGREITIEGLVAEFQFVNPHPFVTISIKTANQGTQQWRLEMDNRSELVQIGIDSGTFKPGDRVIATGSPGRDKALALYVRRLDRPLDGLRYEQIGSTPRIQFSPKP